jgi:hypothetical protein
VSTATLVKQKPDLQKALDCLIEMMNSGDIEGARQYVKQLVRKWPDAERVQHYSRVLEPPRVIAVGPSTGYSLEHEKPWLKAHAHKYPGCWLALDGPRLIAADPDIQVVRKAAQQDGANDPLFHFQPTPRQ